MLFLYLLVSRLGLLPPLCWTALPWAASVQSSLLPHPHTHPSSLSLSLSLMPPVLSLGSVSSQCARFLLSPYTLHTYVSSPILFPRLVSSKTPICCLYFFHIRTPCRQVQSLASTISLPSPPRLGRRSIPCARALARASSCIFYSSTPRGTS